MESNTIATTSTHNSIVEEKKDAFKHLPWKRANNAEAIAKGLDFIPDSWVITPVINKKPCRKNWNGENPVSKDVIRNHILYGVETVSEKGRKYTQYISGFGIRTGEISGGIIAIDEDGEIPGEILEKIVEKLGDGQLPKTISLTSGKKGRKQSLYQIPDIYREAFKPITKVVLDSFDGISSNDGGLEFRYGHINQSVLPPSIHPNTGCYKWINSPEDTEIGILPAWMCDFIINEWNKKIENVKTEIPKVVERGESSQSSQCLSDFVHYVVVPKIPFDELFNVIDHNFIYDCDTYKGIPPFRDSEGNTSFHVWLDEHGKWGWHDKKLDIGGDIINYIWQYEHVKSGTPTGHWFVKIVQNLAFKAGIDLPEWQPKENNSNSENESQSNFENSVFKKSDNKHNKKYSISKIEDCIREILSKGLLSSQESKELSHLHFRLQNEFKFPAKFFNELINSVRKDLGVIDSLEQKRLNNLLEAGKAELNLFDIFPKTLAEAIENEAKIKNIEPIILIQLLFPAISSLVGNKVNLRINSHKVPAIIWSAIVGAPSTGKSRGADSIIEPIFKLQAKSLEKLAEQRQKYEDEMLDYEEKYNSIVKSVGNSSNRKPDISPEFLQFIENKNLIVDELNKSEILNLARESGELIKPEEPKPRTYLFDDSTVSAVQNTLVSNPTHSGLWYTDEISSIFDSLGQYSKTSKSNDRPRLLKLWDGKDISITRVASEPKISNGSALSLTGGIQPGVFRKAFKDVEDSDGLQARFLFASTKRLDSHESLEIAELSGKLNHFYQFLDSIPNLEIRFSKEAYEMYWQIKKKEDEWYKKSSSTAMQNWIGKFNSHVSRLAICFHLIETYYKGNVINLDEKDGTQYGLSLEISALTMQRALTLGLFYKQSLEYLLGTVADSDDEHLILLQIQELSKTFDEGITIRDIYRKVKGVERYAKLEDQKPTMVAESFIKKLEKYGYGSIKKKGKSLFYKAFDKVLGFNLQESSSESLVNVEIDIDSFDIYEDEEKVIPINQKQKVQEPTQPVEEVQETTPTIQEVEAIQEVEETKLEREPNKDLRIDKDYCKYFKDNLPLENMKAWIGIKGCYKKDNKTYFLIEIKRNKKLIIERTNGTKTVECNIEEFEIYDNEIEELPKAC
ncbi:hypothetical protein WA1_23980 [Scytonema hofmannii PCC 7110]|uniref:DNA primase/polymerase bifunctional N-terminal domain-containing protein n=1 Tax=Scytonema hofmannii PCC 7110 TaxID=128403 RepID=A0A139X7U9_9CYAN|nr:DUF3987 domain-containing protein [Scytonema hofmannii]KYC40703.1 hypothetical protein WA1_23980 [Scytonema hofmannii PCC 7110]